MPTPLGHSLAGLAIWAADRRPVNLSNAFTRENLGWAVYCIAVSNAPDLDFIHLQDGALAITDKYHHGISHSVGFALGFGVLAWLWGVIRARADALRLFVVTSMLYGLHVFLDIFSIDTYPVNGIGVPALWPFSDKYFVVQLIHSADRTNPFSFYSLKALALEVAICGLFLLGAIIWNRRGNENGKS